jgi:hypothetical protein
MGGDWRAKVLRKCKIVSEIYGSAITNESECCARSYEHWMQTGEDRHLKTSQNVLEKAPLKSSQPRKYQHFRADPLFGGTIDTENMCQPFNAPNRHSGEWISENPFETSI